eukprot:TRINITY_DN1303_c0_g1_i1.p1 TRINITY_DN1303_c0_g1~~TRINITY_DN1303_c0_g1_i1.p1  ORF type:complete len:283 (-),score=36.67 TRINITY_DN1303_c0_g1_i1:146-994(-)
MMTEKLCYMKTYLVLLLLLPLSQASVQPMERGRCDAFEFLKGFLEGLNEKGDINKLIHCIRNIDDIAEKIVRALELIIAGDIREIFEGVRLLVEGVQEYINTIVPCAKGFHQIKRLFKKLQRLEIRVIFHKIIQNAEFYRNLIEKCIDTFRKKEYKLAGKHLGQLLFLLFLSDLPYSQAGLHDSPIHQNFTANFRQCAIAAISAISQLRASKALATNLNALKEKLVSLSQCVPESFGKSLANAEITQGSGIPGNSPLIVGGRLNAGAKRVSKGYHSQLANSL